MPVDHCSQPEFYHGHLFHEHEKRMRIVVVLTCVMMVVEILGGWWFGSMALLADGFHMGTHMGALGVSAFAYSYARKHAHDERYSFGTGKVGDLAGFASAIMLGLIGLYVLNESFWRFVEPINIHYGEAMFIAVLGLGVNVASAAILKAKHSHDHAHHHHDNNFRSAYMHVLADALTSVTAIAALACGWMFGWQRMDPLMGMVGAVVIMVWAWGLLRDTSAVLLDRTPDTEATSKIRQIMASQDIVIKDLHVWRIGPGVQAAIMSLKVSNSVTAERVREWLRPLNLAHITVEINQ